MIKSRRWFSVGEAAEFLGLSTGVIKRLLTTRQLRSTTIPGDAGRRRRIPRQDLIQLRQGLERGLEEQP